MKEIFSLRQTDRPVREKYKLNIPSCNQVTFGCKALTFFGPKTWNSLPYHIKSKIENRKSSETGSEVFRQKLQHIIMKIYY